MASNDSLIKQRSVIEFLTAEGCSAASIYDRMKSVFGNMCISDSAVREWVRYFRGEDPTETTVRDRKRPGRPLSASDTVHQEAIDCMIRSNRRVKQSVIANKVGISKERVHHIVTHLLGYRKVSARRVPRQLTLEMKTQRKKMRIHHLKRYNKKERLFWKELLPEMNRGSTTSTQRANFNQWSIGKKNISQSKEVQSYCISKKGPLNHILGHEGSS